MRQRDSGQSHDLLRTLGRALRPRPGVHLQPAAVLLDSELHRSNSFTAARHLPVSAHLCPHLRLQQEESFGRAGGQKVERKCPTGDQLQRFDFLKMSEMCPNKILPTSPTATTNLPAAKRQGQ